MSEQDNYQISTPHDIVSPQLNEYNDLVFDIGFLPYNSIFYLLLNNQKIQSFKTISNDYFVIEFQSDNNSLSTIDPRLVQLDQFDFLLQAEINQQMHTIFAGVTFPDSINQMFQVVQDDNLLIYVNGAKVASLKCKISTLLELKFEYFQQGNHINMLIYRDGIISNRVICTE